VTPPVGPSDRHAFETLLDAQRNWIANLPATLWLQDDVLLVHGTPRSDEEYFLETVTDLGCRSATTSEILERADDIHASLILCGHTHVPRSVVLDDGRVIVNPGSVGRQACESREPFVHRIETGSAHARYALIERRGTSWNAEIRLVAYDWNRFDRLAAGQCKSQFDCAWAGDRGRFDRMLGPESELDARLQHEQRERGRILDRCRSQQIRIESSTQSPGCQNRGYRGTFALDLCDCVVSGGI
jgi:Calcineurin-like phosphoesterase superfamily domain